MFNNASYIDANILLESILPNRQRVGAARQYMQKHFTTISPLSVHLLAHFGTRYKVDLDVLLELAKQHRLTDFGATEIAWATRYREDDDFEDALQVGCAVMAGCKEFVTFDKKLAKLYGKHITMKLL